MDIDYKVNNSYLRSLIFDFQFQSSEIDVVFMSNIFQQFQHFGELNIEQQNSLLLQFQNIFASKSSNFLNNTEIQIISNFISNFIGFSQCSCSILLFLQFFCEWTYSHDVENESFASQKETLPFLLFHSIQNPSFDINIQIFSLSILLNLINDSKFIRVDLIKNCLNDESQLQLFINLINETKNQTIAIVIFRIFNIILKLEDASQINFGLVIKNLIFPSLSNLFNDFPNECIEFVSTFLRKLKNDKKCFISDLISNISFDDIYKSIHEFDEDKIVEFLSFLRSIIDNNDWPNDLHVKINFDSIISITEKCSFKLKKSFCELLISYFSNQSLFDINYEYEPLFNHLCLMTNDDFRSLDYVLSVYHTIFVSDKDITFFNPLESIKPNVDVLLNFFIDFLESDSEEFSKKAFQIISSIIDLLFDYDYLVDADQIKSIIKNVILQGNRFDPNDEKIKIIKENFSKID